MTTVMSKLRNISEQLNVSYPVMTRTISGALLLAYALKISYPLIENYSSKNDNFKNSKIQEASMIENQSNLSTQSIEISLSDNENDQDETCQDIDDINTKYDDRLLRLLRKYDSKSKADHSERNLVFGPKPMNKIVEKLEELFIYLMIKLRPLTGFNIDFLVQMLKLLRIMIPRMASYEIFILTMHTLSLISRTFLSIYVANLEGTVVKHIVRKDRKQFILSMTKWLFISVPATFLNSLIRYLECKLSLTFRNRLVNYAYNLYFKNQTYYSVSNLDNRLENVDHSMTDDISTFAQHCAHMYSHVTKPTLDVIVVLFTLFQMGRKMGTNGYHGPLLGSCIVFCTHLILRQVSPRFGSLVAEESRRKGFLRFVHSRIITNAEEIAFYNGENIEKMTLKQSYYSLVKQMNQIYRKRLWYVMLEQLLMKYLWSATGMIVIATPVMLTKSNILTPINDGNSYSNKQSIQNDHSNDSISNRTEYMMTAKNILMSGSDAMERLLSSYKELTELIGYSNRVARMFTIFEMLSKRCYTDRLNLNVNKCKFLTDDNHSIIKFNKITNAPIINGQIEIVHDYIELINVPIITPNCDIILPSLTIKIVPQMHLLITGPNGCGKSSLFRIMAGLWPIFNGTLKRPQSKDMFYIPQRPYMSLGTLRDQLIYPDTIKMMEDKGITDDNLEQILQMVSLNHIVIREGGWNAKADWKDILSGGEKQRMAMARLFYHKPKFALLDECTSAVSIDVESTMYEQAKKFNITLITITHRQTLWKYHTHLLQFDGLGHCSLKSINDQSSIDDEANQIQ